MATAAERARSFGVLADQYDRVRPDYPDEAVDAVVPGTASVAVDVGAGTGKLTASLVARGLRVIAVEPDPGMQEVLARRVPEADRRTGTAEALPVGDGEVDVVCFAQSWHWADPEAASGEAARVLRPGGHLGLLWNVDDYSVAWVQAVSELTRGAPVIGSSGAPGTIPGFCAGHRHVVRWHHRLPRVDFLDLVSTWSAVSTRSDSDRRKVLDLVAQVLDTVPAVSGTDDIDFPQICAAWTYHPASACADRRGRGASASGR